MAAMVETMFSVREKPWHGLGEIIQEAPTSEDALRLAEAECQVYNLHPTYMVYNCPHQFFLWVP